MSAGKMGLCLAFAWVLIASAYGTTLVAVNVAGDPDTLHAFDTAAPAAAGDALTTLAGNFVRGLDLTGELDGYYVASDTLSGSPTGLFRLDGGASTWISDVPFLTSSTGGLTFNQDATGLFVALDPPDTRPFTLFSVDLLGNWTEVGPISIPGINLGIAGLALDPQTGTLYALDNTTDSLLTINQATGAATFVGTLGISANAVGGMDFALDGSGLYIATNVGRIYEVDPATGAAGTLLGQLPFNSSTIAAVPEPAAVALLALLTLTAVRRR